MMMNKNSSRVLVFLFLFVLGIFVLPSITSCGKKGAASNVGLNAQLEVLNLSPDLNPISLYVDYLLQNGTTQYAYPQPSGYFYLNSVDTPIQIRSALNNATNILSLSPVINQNHKYTLFIVGLSGDTSIFPIFTEDDTTGIPPTGFGKIRFVNGAVVPNVPATGSGLDITANGTTAFSNILFRQVSNYVQLPAGNYNFNITQHSATVVLASTFLQNTTVQDGRLYTIYTYGVVGQADSLAFGAGILTNR
jgi:hypothetical protein